MGNLGVARHAAVFVAKGNDGFPVLFFMIKSGIELTFDIKGDVRRCHLSAVGNGHGESPLRIHDVAQLRRDSR